MTDAFAIASKTVTRPRSAATVAVDNLLRKALRVSDPRDPAQIANALLARYPEEAERDRRERAGLPYSNIPDSLPATNASAGAASVELAQALDDLDRDLQALSTSSQLKDVRVEMAGWGRAIRQIGAEGLAAARLAMDSVNLDRAMAARRALGEYARLARYVGALTEGSGLLFRHFAQSCDVFGGLILVAIGEGLAANGITRSTSMIRVAAGELQSRRNAVIMALRALTGSIETALSQDEWPRGLEAYRSLIRQLEMGGQADLRALLEENALAQAMDSLVDLATGASVDALRELSTTSSLLVHRFERLIQFGASVRVAIDEDISEYSPESPPLVAFISALQLFVDAFTAKGSSRLLYIARPPIIAYGLYGGSSADQGVARLTGLAQSRGTILERADCACGCGCEANSVRIQVLVDFLQHLVDRAIDLYAMGTNERGIGAPEVRAATYGIITEQVLLLSTNDPGPGGDVIVDDEKLRHALNAVTDTLQAATGGKASVPDPKVQALLIHELRTLYHAEAQTERLVRSLVPNCYPSLFEVPWETTALYLDGIPVVVPQDERQDAHQSTWPQESLIRGLIRFILLKKFNTDVDQPAPIHMPATLEASFASLGQNRADFRH